METLTDRIAANPNPRRPWRVTRWVQMSWAWGRKIEREAAYDSARNVLAIIGFGTVLGDFAVMHLWMLAPCAVGAVLVWHLDYVRHF